MDTEGCVEMNAGTVDEALMSNVSAGVASLAKPEDGMALMVDDTAVVVLA
jgi:hypothetical protein